MSSYARNSAAEVCSALVQLLALEGLAGPLAGARGIQIYSGPSCTCKAISAPIYSIDYIENYVDAHLGAKLR